MSQTPKKERESTLSSSAQKVNKVARVMYKFFREKSPELGDAFISFANENFEKTGTADGKTIERLVAYMNEVKGPMMEEIKNNPDLPEEAVTIAGNIIGKLTEKYESMLKTA